VEQLAARVQRSRGKNPARPFNVQDFLNASRLAIWELIGSTDDSLAFLGSLGGATGLYLAWEPFLSFSLGIPVVVTECVRFPALFVTWSCYMCLKPATRDFTNLQWDVLILEAGSASMPLALPYVWCLPSPCPSWLLMPCVALSFKLLFSSGVCKMRSKCPKWADRTAMNYHYWTQPLPHPASWFTHHLPDRFHQASVIATLGIEICVPFLLLLPMIWARAAGFVFTVVLMSLIILTGNYGFFNWLTIALTIPVLDDSLLAAVLPTMLLPPMPPLETWGVVSTMLGTAMCLPLGCLVSIAVLAPMMDLPRMTVVELPVWVQRLKQLCKPLHIGNAYGLFASMTTFRHELIFEASLDGQVWQVTSTAL